MRPYVQYMHYSTTSIEHRSRSVVEKAKAYNVLHTYGYVYICPSLMTIIIMMMMSIIFKDSTGGGRKRALFPDHSRHIHPSIPWLTELHQALRQVRMHCCSRLQMKERDLLDSIHGMCRALLVPTWSHCMHMQSSAIHKASWSRQMEWSRQRWLTHSLTRPIIVGFTATTCSHWGSERCFCFDGLCSSCARALYTFKYTCIVQCTYVHKGLMSSSKRWMAKSRSRRRRRRSKVGERFMVFFRIVKGSDRPCSRRHHFVCAPSIYEGNDS